MQQIDDTGIVLSDKGLPSTNSLVALSQDECHRQLRSLILGGTQRATHAGDHLH